MDSLQPPSSPVAGGGDGAGKPCSAAGSRRVSVRLTNGQVVNCDTRKVFSTLKCGSIQKMWLLSDDMLILD